jgi:D-3-phosphoglycerate dehydrogenase / 2-oxoglutarate reductase
VSTDQNSNQSGDPNDLGVRPVKLLVTDTYSGEAMAKLKAELPCHFSKSKDLRPAADELKDVEGLLIRSRTKVDKALIEQAPALKWIVTATSGFDHIDFRTCEAKKITVAHTPTANVQSAAELAVALILSLSRNLPQALATVENNKWRTDELRGLSLEGKTLGLIGLGKVGRKVAATLKALGMTVAAYDPYVNEDVFKQLGVTRQSFSEILVSADFISLHVPLTRETHHMINHQTLRLINPDSFLINTSRGAVIDETELAVALTEGLLKGAALDVFEREPLIRESRLRGRPDTILTPHVGAFTEEAIEKASMEAVSRTIEYFKTGQTKDTLPLQVGWFSLVL